MRAKNSMLLLLYLLVLVSSHALLATQINNKRVKSQVKGALAERKSKRFKLMKITLTTLGSGAMIGLSYLLYFYYRRSSQLSHFLQREELRLQSFQPPLQELRACLEADSPNIEQAKAALQRAERFLHQESPDWDVLDISKHVIRNHPAFLASYTPSDAFLRLNKSRRISMRARVYSNMVYRKKDIDFFGSWYFLAQEDYLSDECRQKLSLVDRNDIGAKLLAPNSHYYSHNIVRFLRDEMISIRAFFIDPSLHVKMTIENHMSYDIPIRFVDNQIICNYPEDLDDYFSLKIVNRSSASLMILPKNSRHTFSLEYELIRGNLHITTSQDLLITDFLKIS